MNNNAIINIIIIALVSAGVSYLCFGILQSTAEGESGTTAVGGAIAGFLVTASLLWRMFQSMSHNVNVETIQNLQTLNQELQNKLMRSASYPEDFTPEVSERERIVLARPKIWQERGGYIFNFEESAIKSDAFPAYFRTWFNVLEDHQKADIEQYYKDIADELRDTTLSFTQERLSIGGEASPHQAVKMIVTYWIRVRFVEQIGGTTERIFEERYLPNSFVGEVIDHDRKVVRSENTVLRVTGSGFKVGETFAYYKGEMLPTNIVDEGHLAIAIPTEVLNDETFLTISLRHENMVGDAFIWVDIENDRSDSSDQDLDVNRDSTDESPSVSISPDHITLEDFKDLPSSLPSSHVQTQRIMLLCRSGEDRVMFFDYEDDIDDAPRSSELFNYIVDSIRFL